MLTSWLKRRRRQRLLATPFPPDWLRVLEHNVPYYALLEPDEQAKLRRDVQLFVAEKNWEGCGGLTLDDTMRVTIAGQACLLALGLDVDCYQRVLSILVYPSEFRTPQQRFFAESSLVGEGLRLGEAWYRGPVILSWADVLRDAREPGDGHNLVWHEFAHQLDMLDRAIDGTPPLAGREQYRAWAKVMTAELAELRRAARFGRPTLLDPYGATNEAEFFAVASETFLDQPVELQAEHPDLYELLKQFYRQDPAARLTGHRRA